MARFTGTREKYNLGKRNTTENYGRDVRLVVFTRLRTEQGDCGCVVRVWCVFPVWRVLRLDGF